MLTKQPKRTFYPTVPGQPFIPDKTVCPPDTPSGGGTGGHWEYVCETPCVPVGIDNGPATPTNPGPFPKTVYVCGMPICYSKWIPDDGGFGLG